MSAYLFTLMIIVLSIAVAEWSEWINTEERGWSDNISTTILKSDNNSTITRICTTSYRWLYSEYSSISAYFSDNHAAFAGRPRNTDRLCTNRVNEGQCFTSVYVTYKKQRDICGLQLRTSDHILFDFLGDRVETIMIMLEQNNAISLSVGMDGDEAAIASGKPHECLTAIGVRWSMTQYSIYQIRFYFSESGHVEDESEDVVSDPLEEVVSESGWSQWFGSNISTDNVFTFKSDTNAHITQICATYAKFRYYYSISAYFSDNHAALAGSPSRTDRECTDTVNEGECFTSVYVAYAISTNYSLVRGLQLRTSDHKLLDFFGAHGPLLKQEYGVRSFPITGSEAGIASGMKHECLTGIGVDYISNKNIVSRVRFHFSESGYLEDDISDPLEDEEVASDLEEASDTGWSEWFGSDNATNATDELITLKSDNNGTITQICATFAIFDKSVDYFTSISSYFSDNHAALAGDASSLWTDRRCTDSVNEGECFTSIYVTFDSAVRGLQLMTSDDILFDFFGARINVTRGRRWMNDGYSLNTRVVVSANAGSEGGIASGKQHECLTGIGVNYWNHTLFSHIRFHFSGTDDLEDAVSNESVVSDPPDLWDIVANQSDLEEVVSETTQISTTQRTSATTKQQVIVVNIDRGSDDWSQTSNILSSIMIVIIVCICLMAMVYKMCEHQSLGLIAKNDQDKLEIEVKKHESFNIDLKIEEEDEMKKIEDEGTKKDNDGETLKIELKKSETRSPKKKKTKKRRNDGKTLEIESNKKKKRKKKKSMSTH